MNVVAVIPAAGTSSRYNPQKNKLLEEIKGIPVIIHTLRVISSVNEIDEIVIPTSKKLIEKISDLIKEYEIPKIKKIILGGRTRQESVFIGLKEFESDKPDWALIHDAARPLVSPEIISSSIMTAVKKRASIVAVPVKDTIKKIDGATGEIIETVERQNLWNVQTPQVFKYSDILGVHEGFNGENLTDDSALMEKAGFKVFVCEGSYKNIKITTREDLEIAKNLMD